jgi:hypothetical protein
VDVRDLRPEFADCGVHERARLLDGVLRDPRV